MSRIIDFHSHILPGADHGSDGIETSLGQLTLLHTAGTQAVVATPHFEPENDTVESFLERRKRATECLLLHLPEKAPAIYIGAEVLLCEGMEAMPGLEKLCVTGTNLLLLERPFLPLTEAMVATVFHIHQLGYRILLAHIDRYDLWETCGILYDGVYAQLNSAALQSAFHRRKWKKLFQDGVIGAFGSDLHGCPTDYNGFSRLPAIYPEFFPAVMEESERLLAGAVPLC